MDAELRTGLMNRAYYDASGVGGSTWSDLDIIGDVQLPNAWNETQLKERGQSHEGTVLGQGTLDITFTLTRRIGNAAYEALRDAHLNKAVIGLAFMSDDIELAGSEGWQGDFVVPTFPISEEVDPANLIEVTVKPAPGTSPSYVVVEATT